MRTPSHTSISIDDIRADLTGQVIAAEDTEYEHARSVFYATFDRRPAAIIRPADAGEVAYVVNLARESGLDLAVRSGGTRAPATASARAGSSLTSPR